MKALVVYDSVFGNTEQVTYEHTALTLLSVIYFVIGMTLFSGTHLQPG